MTSQRQSLRAVLAMSLLIAAGCGGSPGEETTSAEATIRGVVKLDGKPATEGEIVFDPSNYKRPAPQSKATIGKDGTYEVKTLAGQNVVFLGGTLARKYGILQRRRKNFTATAGDNTFDFETETK